MGKDFGPIIIGAVRGMKSALSRAVGLIVFSLIVFLPRSGYAEKLVIAWAAVSALNSPFWVMNDAGWDNAPIPSIRRTFNPKV